MNLIQINDKYTVDDDFDQFISKQNRDSVGPKGFVRLIKNNKPITTFMPNLVVASGRRFVAQKLFNKKYTTDTDFFSSGIYAVTHFGIGSGGSLITEGIVTLNGPNMCDEDLITPIPLSDANVNYLTSPGAPNLLPVPTVATPYVCKRIESDGTITVVQNQSISCTDPWYTWVRCRCIKSVGEPDNILDGESVKIDEACLYYTDYIDTPTDVDVHTFAHICFAPKWIEKEVELIIEWYILC